MERIAPEFLDSAFQSANNEEMVAAQVDLHGILDRHPQFLAFLQGASKALIKVAPDGLSCVMTAMLTGLCYGRKYEQLARESTEVADLEKMFQRE